MSGRRGHGEGSVHRREDGRWVAALDLGWREGRRQRRYVYGKTRRDVVAKLDELRRRHDEGLVVTTSSTKFEQFVADFLEVWKTRVRPQTWQRYESYFRRQVLPTLGRVRLDGLTAQHFERLYAQLLSDGLSAQTVIHVHRVVHVALKHALRSGLVAYNVAERVDPPRAHRTMMHTLSGDEARRFLVAASGDRLEALYTLALTTGMRQGELLGLHWRDVDLGKRRLSVNVALHRLGGKFVFDEPKSASSRRSLELSVLAVEALRRHRVRQAQERLAAGERWVDLDLVFPNEVGNPINVSNLIPRSFHPLLEKAGVPRIRFHDLRHTAATLLLEQGEHPKVVQEMLGHSQIGLTLDTYSHVTPGMHRKAADTFDRLLG